MLSRVWSCALLGVDAVPVCIETHTEPALPSFHLVGLPDSVVRESRTRVLSAIRNSGFEIPRGRIVVNLAPAEIPKEGSALDLPIAVGLLAAEGIVSQDNLDGFNLVGELSLGGSVKRVRGVLPAAVAAGSSDRDALIVPAGNEVEASAVANVDVYPVSGLKETVEVLTDPARATPFRSDIGRRLRRTPTTPNDMGDVRGQEFVKRALEIAAAGGHNVLMIGAPGAGKTMLARRLPGILPPLSLEEALETTKIHSVGGKLEAAMGLVTERPFRAPHHTISEAGLVGGGANPRPGEISLAHNGVLFLDELPEFRRSTLEVMRQPLEEGRVTITRSRVSVDFPARFMLVASMNPCPCGYLNNADRECVCSASAIHRYRSRLSGPLIDRIDMHVEVMAVPFEKLTADGRSAGSADILQRVVGARLVQDRRFSEVPGVYSNAQMGTKSVQMHCSLDAAGTRLMRRAVERFGLSARGFSRLLKVARTIADLAEASEVPAEAVAEAIQYRALDASPHP